MGVLGHDTVVPVTTQKPDPAPCVVSWAVGRHVGLAAQKTALGLPRQISGHPHPRPPPEPTGAAPPLSELGLGLAGKPWLLTESPVARELLVNLLHSFDVEPAGLGVIDDGPWVVHADDTLGGLLDRLWGVPGLVDVSRGEPFQFGQVSPETDNASAHPDPPSERRESPILGGGHSGREAVCLACTLT